jgi:hypothetical protein
MAKKNPDHFIDPGKGCRFPFNNRFFLCFRTIPANSPDSLLAPDSLFRAALQAYFRRPHPGNRIHDQCSNIPFYLLLTIRFWAASIR